MNATMDSIYAAFIERVSKGRKLTPEMVEKIAKGRVWTGKQGLENGLVDELGGLDAALDYTAKSLGVADRTKLDIVNLPEPKSALEQIVDLMDGNTVMAKIGGVLMNTLDRKVEQARVPHVTAYDPFLDRKL